MDHKNDEQHDTDKPPINIPPVDAPKKVITRRELDSEFQKRFDRISEEFRQGLTFIREHPKSVSFFGSARLPETHPYYKKAQSLARRISCEGFAVITGGGPGIMEAANKGAYEVNCDGPSLGMNIELPMEQILNPYVDDFVNFYYFFTRKVSLTFSAEAYVFFPGGFGTLDEFFEIVTLIQTEKIERVPVILVGDEFWGEVNTMICDLLLEKYHTIDNVDTSIYTITEDEDKIMEIIRHAPLREGD